MDGDDIHVDEAMNQLGIAGIADADAVIHKSMPVKQQFSLIKTQPGMNDLE